jgi:hypothetical protein
MSYKAKKKTFPYVTVILVLVLALVVGILAFTIIESTGVVGRLSTAVESNNYKITENELHVYEWHVAVQQLSNMYMYNQYYGLYKDTDIGKLMSQYSSAEQFVYDYAATYISSSSAAEQAHSLAEQYLAFCEGADEANFEVSEEEIEKQTDSFFEQLDYAAALLGTQSRSQYVDIAMGKGVSDGDIRSAMKKFTIGGQYANHLSESFSDAVTPEEMEKYKDDNKASFITAKYASYVLPSDTLIEKAKACKTVEEIKKLICEYTVSEQFEKLYETHITKKSIKDVNGKDTTKAMVLETLLAEYEIGENKAKFTKDAKSGTYEAAGYAIYNAISTATKTETKKITENASSGYTEVKDIKDTDTQKDLKKWIWGDKGRQEGDVNVIKTTADKKTTNTWYVITKTPGLDTAKTRDAYYYLIKNDKTSAAEVKANEFFTALQKDKTTKKFDELATKYGSTMSSNLYESIAKESLGEEVDAWLFAAERKEGDISKIAVTSGCYVMYYVEENEENWKVSARSGVANEKFTKWSEDAVKKYGVVSNYEPETTEPATTAAA